MKKTLLLLLISVLFLSGCDKKKAEEQPKENELGEEKTELLTYEDYIEEFEFFGSIGYDRGMCTGERVTENFCTITLNELKTELGEDYDLSKLYTYKGVACDGNLAAIVIELDKSSKEQGIEASYRFDRGCMPPEAKTPNK